MPNWCSVHLNVSWDRSELVDFATKLIGKKQLIIDQLPDNEGLYNNEKIEKLIEMQNNGELELTYSILVPQPEDVLLNKGGNKWYNWRIENCGVKWDIGDDCTTVDDLLNSIEDVKNGANSISMYIEAPWYYPDKFLITVSEIYTKLTFNLMAEEGGCDIYTERVYGNGEDIEMFSCESGVEWRAYESGTISIKIEEFLSYGDTNNEEYIQYLVNSMQHFKDRPPEKTYLDILNNIHSSCGEEDLDFEGDYETFKCLFEEMIKKEDWY